MNKLDVIARQVQMAQEDLAKGDLQRVENALSTLQFVLAGGNVPPTTTRNGSGGRPQTEKSKKLDTVIEEVLTKNGPMRIGELTAQIKKRRTPLPGKGDPANLIAHLGRMPNVRRVSRGVYGLKGKGSK